LFEVWPCGQRGGCSGSNQNQISEIASGGKQVTQLENALAALRRGFLVFPCYPKSKKAAYVKGVLEHGCVDATSDEAIIRRWWGINPDFNPAITGGTIIDADVGLPSLKDALAFATDNFFPDTFLVRTGRRPEFGAQFHFQNVLTSGLYDARGITGELRGKNEYGMAPGSVHPSGTLYEIAVDLPRAIADENLLRAFRIKPPSANAPKPGFKVGAGKRFYWLRSQAGRLVNAGLSGAALVAALKSLNQDYCDPPKDDVDVETLANAASEKFTANVEPPPTQQAEDSFPARTATLEEFNKKYFVVADLGGKCRVCHEVISEDNGNLVLVHQEFDDLRKAFMHQRIVVDSHTKTVGKGEHAEEIEILEYKDKANFWLDHKDRRQFERIAFAPNETLPPEVKNLWRGFRVEAREGKIPRYLEHIFENICKANQARYDWYMRWQAWKIRNPGLQNGTCPVLIGPEGIGKNVAADAFAFLFGPHAFLATKPEDVVGHFNFHLRACCFLLGNESLYAGNRRDGNVLKTLITERMMSIEGKGIDSRMERNRLSVMLATNEPWAVLAGISARRFSVFDVGTKHIQDHEYFNTIALELGGARGTLSGYSALLHHLLFEVELKDFQPQQIILTDALVSQQAQSLHGAEALWHSILFRGEMPGGLPGNLLLIERLLKWAQLQHNRKFEGISDRQMAQLLGENTVGEARGMGFSHKHPRPMVDGHRIRPWVIPSLREARRLWDERRFVEQWPELTALNPMVLQDAPDPDDWQYVAVGDERTPMSAAAVESTKEAIREVVKAMKTAANVEKTKEEEEEDWEIPF
jgi:hypothetical protein